jgi:hypothetical protein
MSKNKVREGEMKAQKNESSGKPKMDFFFSQNSLGSPPFQKILGSEDEEDDDGDLAWRVGDWRNMENI